MIERPERIENSLVSYAWGVPNGLSKRLGLPETGQPEAELWIGAHPSHPSRFVRRDSEWETLADWGELPFLMKILAVDAVLSIQVHPELIPSQAGFARENAEGIALDAPNRSYRDENAKPELVIAIDGGFEALSGFRQRKELARVLHELIKFEPKLEATCLFVAEKNLAASVYRMIEDHQLVRNALSALDEVPEPELPRGLTSRHVQHLREIASQYPADPGLGVALMLNYVELKTGEALWLPAGNPHAYLAGYAVEVTGPSDNIVRGGLTKKHMNAQAFAETVRTRPRIPEILRPPTVNNKRWFRPEFREQDGSPFQVVEITGDTSLELASPGCFIVLDGNFSIGGESLGRGEQLFLPAQELTFAGSGLAYLATGA